MRYLIALISTALLVPLWYAMSGGTMPEAARLELFGIPLATLFVLAEMAALVGLCWISMKIVARDDAPASRGEGPLPPLEEDAS